MKQIIMAALLISFSWGIRAQQLQIRGKVIDLSDKSPLEFANITLQTADSAFITGTTTDSKGLFRIEKVKAGDYQVSVSSIGYKTSVSAIRRTVRSRSLPLSKKRLPAMASIY